MPAAIAITFLSAPASSTPTTSVLEYARNTGLDTTRCTSSATAGSAEATTTAVGWRCSDLRRERRARQDRERAAGRLRRGHLAHAQERVELEALGGRDERAAAAAAGGASSR